VTLDSNHIVWFKRDLRIADNSPFASAARAGKVLSLYIVEPELWKLPDSSLRHWYFIHDSLRELNLDLVAKGAHLTFRIGEAVEVLESIRRIIGSFTLWSHQETGNGWTFNRDIKVAKWCKLNGIIWQELPSNGVVRRLKSRDVWSGLRSERMEAPIITELSYFSELTRKK
jgi:deoxyribodipyrimidine photo-lyase